MELKSQQLICFSYACSSQSDILLKRIKYSNKILLPPNILYELNKNSNEFNSPLFFKITNKENKLEEVCGVQEFTSPPGVVHVPYHIMEELGIKEGDNVDIELFIPSDGTYIKLRPHATEFINLSDPKAVLEKVLSKDYPVVKKGSTICINHEESNRIFYIDILETKPESIIKIINVDINVDFDEPLDYVPSEKPKPKLNTFLKKNDDDLKKEDAEKHDLKRFPGTGNRLGTK
jgi:ubiquitin fusion degradation protein 1